MDVRELEWQFDAVDLRPVMRWLADPARQADAGAVRVDPGGSASQVDVYLDTDDHRFQRRMRGGRYAAVESPSMLSERAARPAPR